ncbi:hypothetical protein [Sphingobium yanoikuyae]|uniref:hypothetical protein n=1 Tax=Sphingobium yanoikuyae TaxID=13690 RepID=UPI002FDD8FC4
MLTDAEEALMRLTVDLWNGFLSLPNEHGSDRPEFLATVHDLQRHILSRPARRELNSAPTRWADPLFPAKDRS